MEYENEITFEDRLLRGHLHSVEELPTEPSNQIKLFVSCAGSDFDEERNELFTKVVPKVREEVKQKYGLEFHYMDLRQGVDVDNERDFETREFFLKELLRAQQLSAGAHYMVLLGQRYGSCPLPQLILSDIFEMIETSIVNSRSRRARGSKLLSMWYKQDKNSIPAVHVLQPKTVPSKFKEFTIKSLEEEKELLLGLLKYGVELCCKEGFLPAEAIRSYFASDFESEIKHGLIDEPGSALIFSRTITDLKNYVNEPQAQTFTETSFDEESESNVIKADSSYLLEQVKTNLIATSVPDCNQKCSSILWRYDTGVHPVHHREYLDGICDSFYTNIMRLCGDAAAKCHAKKVVRPALVQEVLAHYNLVFERGTDCQGRDFELTQITEYITDKSNREYFTVYGETGSGKTCLLAKTLLEIESILEGETISIIRHIGLTSSSSTLKELLQGICEQLSDCLNIKSNIPTDMKSLYTLFDTLIHSVPSDVTLCLLLDSLHNLQEEHAHTLHWLPSTFPTNVKVIVTCLPEKHNIFNRIRTEIIRNQSNFVKVTELGEDKGMSLVLHWLNRDSRCMNDQQAQLVRDKLRSCSLPLYIKLIYSQISEWRSFDGVSPDSLAVDVQSFLDKLFSDLEVKHEAAVVKHAMAYLTASSTGLSDIEMEDLLSMDEDALKSIFLARKKTPVIRRCPMSVWARLRDSISHFLNLKQQDDCDIYVWAHNSFCEFIRSRYLKDAVFVKEIHRMISDYYLGTQHGRELPFINERGQEQKANRYILSQPLTYVGVTGETRYNRRKYDQVPRHLYLAGRLDELNDRVMFNYDWLYNKIKVLSLQHILADLSLNPSTEATLLEGALRSAEPTLLTNIDNMPAELSGRLLPYYQTHAYIRSLIDQCDRSGLNQCALVPAFSYHQVPGSPLKSAFENHDVIDQLHLVNGGSELIMKTVHCQTVKRFDLKLYESINEVKTSFGEMHMTPDGRHLVIIDKEIEKSLKVHRLEDGMFEGQIIPINFIQTKERAKFTLGSVSITNSHVAILAYSDVSYLCVASLSSSFDLVRTFQLPGRAQILQISPVGNFILCCINNNVYAYKMANFEQIYVTELPYKPTNYCFTNQASKIYLCDDDSGLITVISLSPDGRTQMVSKIPLISQFKGDSIRKIQLSHNQQLLSVKGDGVIVVYNLMTDKIQLVINRPPGALTEFRLPKNSEATPVNYTNCLFSFDDKLLIVSYFRNILFWDIRDGTPLPLSILAPVGIIQKVLLSPINEQIITVQQGSSCAQVWCPDNYIMDVTTLDRLSSPVQKIEMSGNSAFAFVSGQKSDEIGVIDMNTCTLSNLLTHEAPVVKHVSNQSGSYLFTTLQPSKTEFCHKIWSVNDRIIIKQFGQSVGYTVALKKKDSIIHLNQTSSKFLAPSKLTFFTFVGHDVIETEYDFVINHVVSEPFITCDDTYMALLTSDQYIEHSASYSPPSISAFYLKGRYMHSVIGRNELENFLDNRKFLALKPVVDRPTQIIALYESNETSRMGYLQIDLANTEIIRYSDNFMPLETCIPSLLLSNNGEQCYNVKTGESFEMVTGAALTSINNRGSEMVLLNAGEVAVYYRETHLVAERIKDSKIIANIDAHLTICHLKSMDNDHTVLVGCTDGSVLSFVLLDGANRLNPDHVLSKIPSRMLSQNGVEESSVDGADDDRPNTAQSWDQPSLSATLSSTTTLQSPFSILPEDKEVLQKIRPLYRHNTALLTRPLTKYSHLMRSHSMSAQPNRSQTCAIM